jgi:hypothetical protein
MRSMQYKAGTGENPIIFLVCVEMAKFKVLRLRTQFYAAVQHKKHENTLNLRLRVLLY